MMFEDSQENEVPTKVSSRVHWLRELRLDRGISVERVSLLPTAGRAMTVAPAFVDHQDGRQTGCARSLRDQDSLVRLEPSLLKQAEVVREVGEGEPPCAGVKRSGVGIIPRSGRMAVFPKFA
jgi:hypothetical protein